MISTINLFTVFGALTIVYGVLLFFFPPKYNTNFFSIRTKEIVRNEETWAYGHKLFGNFIPILGMVMIGFGLMGIHSMMYKFASALAVIALWQFMKSATDRMISKKFPGI